MRITCVIGTLGGGGAERVMTYLCAGLASRGHQVTLLTLDDSVPDFYQTPASVLRVREHLGAFKESGFWGSFPRLWRLMRAVADTRPDVVISFMTISVLAACWLLRVPYIYADHLDVRHLEYSRKWQILRNFLLARASRVTVLSERDRKFLAMYFPKWRASVVYNPAMPADTQKYPRPAFLEPGKKYVLAVGRLVKQKGFEGVSKDLEDFYGGAAAKLATTGTGLLSTITGKLKSGVADFGLNIVEQLKPVFTNIIGLIDKAMPYVQEFGVKFGEGLGKGIQYISSIMPSFINGFKMMMPAIQSIILGVQQMLPPIMAFGGTIVTTIQNVVIKATPIIDQIIQAIARILPAVQPIFSTLVTTIGNIVTTVLPPLGTAFSMIADVIVAIAPIISDTFAGISEVVTNAISGISSVIQGGLDLISAIWTGSWQGVVDAFASIFGGIAEICKAPMNAVIAIINGAIRAINSISVDIPAWVPGVGGQHWGLNLGQIPYLAKGGVVNEATTAVIGEAGKEVVMPLERNTGWIGQLAGQIMSRMAGFSIQLPTVGKDIPMTNGNTISPASSGKTLSVVITIAKLADSIIVKEKDDIDDIAEEVADKILEVVENL